jgi:hypothetical protein
MMPMSNPPSYLAYAVDVTNTDGIWNVTVGNLSYDFGEDEAAAQIFAVQARKRTAALVEWVSRAKALLRQIEELLAQAGTLRVLYDDNQLYELLMATPQTSLMPGVGLSLPRVLSLGCFFQDITVFLGEDLVGVPPAPILLGKRRAVITLRD